MITENEVKGLLWMAGCITKKMDREYTFRLLKLDRLKIIYKEYEVSPRFAFTLYFVYFFPFAEFSISVR